MEPHHRETIHRCLGDLVDGTHHNLDSVRDTLFRKGVFNERMANTFRDERVSKQHRARDMFMYIETRGPAAFSLLVETLTETGHVRVARQLDPTMDSLSGRSPTSQAVAGKQQRQSDGPPTRRCHPSNLPQYSLANGSSHLIHDMGIAVPNSYINIGEQPKPIIVTMATERRDRSYTPNLHAYPMGSRPKGILLMINNIEFVNDIEQKREGAEVDDVQLKSLFTQLGYVVRDHRNLTHQQMTRAIVEFAGESSLSHVCSVVVAVMSHGRGEPRVREENQPDDPLGVVTHVITTDGQLIETEWIISQFNGTNCPAMIRKPKIFLFQVCRGTNKEHAMRSPMSVVNRTSVDGTPQPAAMKYMRSSGDMLIAYSTVPGNVSNRDRYLGTWYIQAVCEVFMEYAHRHNIEELLKMVDKSLAALVCEELTMQTSCFENRGFDHFFFNPGLYDEPSYETLPASTAPSYETLPASQEDTQSMENSDTRRIYQDSQLPTVVGSQSQLPTVVGSQSQLPAVVGSQSQLPTVVGSQPQLPTVVGSQSQLPAVVGSQSQQPMEYQEGVGGLPDSVEEGMSVSLSFKECDLQMA